MQMTRIHRYFFVLAASAFYSVSAADEVAYKCTDEYGNVSYSDITCPHDMKGSAIKQRSMNPRDENPESTVKKDAKHSIANKIMPTKSDLIGKWTNSRSKEDKKYAITVQFNFTTVVVKNHLGLIGKGTYRINKDILTIYHEAIAEGMDAYEEELKITIFDKDTISLDTVRYSRIK